MAEDLPTLAAYSVALQAHREHPVRFELRVLDLTMLVAALQLALRHPRFPVSIRHYVEDFVDSALTNLGRLAPVLQQVLAAGNDPAQEVPWNNEEDPP